METVATRAETAPMPVKQPSVLAVVVTHDGRAWLRDCLIALANQSYGLLDVLVVDDASPYPKERPLLKRIAKRHLRQRRWGFLRTPRSLGFGGAINWALSRVRTDADLLLFVHDDAALSRDSVERMVERTLADERVAVVGPKIVQWDRPDTLEEVGMAVDRLGYPYKGLEEGEIDLGQHDDPSEVFYVTSTCMLVRHDLFKRLRGWDARLGAFSEDLDLCWRARLMGYSVRFEPRAVARHAIALATGQRRSRFYPARYYSRRNRLRTVTKNASTLRLLLLLPQFVLLAFAEMIAFLVLRQPREVGHLARALLWNLLRGPQTLSERARVQRNRSVTDRQLGHLTVRESTRIRVYVANQAERLETAWGRRAEYVSEKGQQARSLTAGIKPYQVASGVSLAILIMLAFRHFAWGPSVSVGELLPYSAGWTTMIREWGSAWHESSLGRPGIAPASYFILGVFQVFALGGAGAAQKLLVMALGAGAFIGAYRLVSDAVDRPARFAAGLAYVVGSLGYAALRGGALGALVFGAAAPFALHSILRLTGWTRPPRWSGGREAARLAVYSAISAAFVPGSLVLYAVAAALLTGCRTVLAPGRGELKALGGAMASLAVGWAMLLPWSATWFEPAGPLGQLFSADTYRHYAAAFAGHGMTSVLLGQTPDGPALFGLALPLFGVVAVVTGEGQRRRLAIALWGLIVTTGLLAVLFAGGVLRPLVATPTELGVLAALAFAGLVGLAVGAFRLDLPRRRLGAVHALTIAALAAGGFLAAAGLLPAMVAGEWDPGRGTGAAPSEVTEQIGSLMGAEAGESEVFRALWVGEGWSTRQPSAALGVSEHFLTDQAGRELSDLFAPDDADSRSEFEEVVGSVESGATDRAGKLLGVFNVRFVVLEPGSASDAWLEQRDLALVRSEPQFMVLENISNFPRAALYNELPRPVSAIANDDPTAATEAGLVTRAVAAADSATQYEIRNAGGPGVVFLAETNDPTWEASVDGVPLRRVDGGWGNAFDVRESLHGELELSFPHSGLEVTLLVILLLVWAFMIGAAFPSRSGGGDGARGRRP